VGVHRLYSLSSASVEYLSIFYAGRVDFLYFCQLNYLILLLLNSMQQNQLQVEALINRQVERLLALQDLQDLDQLLD
jgi:hypothetical protein